MIDIELVSALELMKVLTRSKLVELIDPLEIMTDFASLTIYFDSGND